MDNITTDNLNSLVEEVLSNKAYLQDPTIVTEFYCSGKALMELFEKGFFDSITLYTIKHSKDQVKVILSAQ